MGKKKQELKEQLALATQRVHAADQDVNALVRENESLREQLAAGVMAPPFRMVTDAAPTPTRMKIAEVLGIDTTNLAAITDDVILAAIERLRNPHLDDHGYPSEAIAVTKNDSLAEAIQHNRKERGDLLDNVTTLRSLLARVAAALNVQWTHASSGDEIIEKAQRFGVFHHWLRKRLNAQDTTLASLPEGGEVPLGPQLLSAELRTIIAALVGDKELNRMLANRPSLKASKTVLDLAENHAPSGNTYLDAPFTQHDAEFIRMALEKTATTAGTKRVGQLHLVFSALHRSPAATQEFVDLMNVLILPILRKQHPAYAAPAPTEN